MIYLPTQGASVACTTNPGDEAAWALYTGAIMVDEPVTIRAKAIRYGCAESEEARVVFEIDPQ